MRVVGVKSVAKYLKRLTNTENTAGQQVPRSLSNNKFVAKKKQSFLVENC